MLLQISGRSRARLRVVLVAFVIVVIAFLLRDTLRKLAGLMLGAGVICFVTLPLDRWFERRLSRPAAALCALGALGVIVAGLVFLLLPAMLRELAELIRALPAYLARLSAWISGANDWLAQRLPGLSLPTLGLSAPPEALTGIAGGTISLAVNATDVLGRASMMGVLAYFFLRDRERLLLRLELLLPQRCRHTAVRISNAVVRELQLYLRGQLMIAAAVSFMSMAALSIVGLRGAALLGPIVGLFNMIPYFGPFIGGIPAVLIALGDGCKRTVLTVLALDIVQQLDGYWISPRIMGSLTGFSPALVLMGIYAGARLAGVKGMLLALPLMMGVRTSFRIFAQKYENN